MSSGRFPKCDVRCGEHVSCFGKVHSASSPPSLHLFLKKQNKLCFLFWFLCNDMQVPALVTGTPCVTDLLLVSCNSWSRVQSIFCV